MNTRLRRPGRWTRIASLIALLIATFMPCAAHGETVHYGFECFALLGLFCLCSITSPVQTFRFIGAGDAMTVMCSAAVVVWSALIAAIADRVFFRQNEARQVLLSVLFAINGFSVGMVLAAPVLLPQIGAAWSGDLLPGSFVWAFAMCGLVAAELLEGSLSTEICPIRGHKTA